MEEQDIMQLWKSYSTKLEESLRLNRKNAEDITRMKVQSFLFSMRPVKIFAILVGLVWVFFADSLIINLFNIANPFFLAAAIIQVVLTKLAIGIYIYQLVLIQQADISEPVHATQHKLAQLKSSTLWVARLLFLQMPVWTFFYWNKGMLENGNMFLYIVQGIVTLSFTYAAVWLFLNIKYENRNKKWFRLIFDGKEWSPVIKSMELLNQLDEYEPAL